MVSRMLSGTEVRLNEDYLADRHRFDSLADHVVYTGPLDAFFDYRLGRLEYRSLRFENEHLELGNYQGNAVINYTDREVPFTRIIEHKWFEFGRDEDGNDLPTTVISREYPAEWKPGDEPYYPINDRKNNDLAEAYRKLAARESRVIFGGRLGDYRYYDMDAVIEQALLRCSEVL
jgi:UDP-galactopyranose mutase